MEQHKSKLREHISQQVAKDPTDAEKIGQHLKDAAINEIAEMLHGVSLKKVRTTWFFVRALT